MSGSGSQRLKCASLEHLHVLSQGMLSHILPRNKSVQFTLTSVQIRVSFFGVSAAEEFWRIPRTVLVTKLCDTCLSANRVAQGIQSGKTP